MGYNREKLVEDDNAIAMMILTSQEKEMAKRTGEKFDAKLRLAKRLYTKGYKKDEVVSLYEFIDLSLDLEIEEEELFWETLKKVESEKKMPYITSVERIGIKKGIKEGALKKSREMVLEALDERFGKIPPEITKKLKSIKDEDKLRIALRRAISSKSLEEFVNWLGSGVK